MREPPPPGTGPRPARPGVGTTTGSGPAHDPGPRRGTPRDHAGRHARDGEAEGGPDRPGFGPTGPFEKKKRETDPDQSPGSPTEVQEEDSSGYGYPEDHLFDIRRKAGGRTLAGYGAPQTDTDSEMGKTEKTRRTAEMMERYPLPWAVSSRNRRMSAVVASNGTVVAGSLICQIMDDRAVSATHQLHAWMVEASRRIRPRQPRQKTPVEREVRLRKGYQARSTDVRVGEMVRDMRKALAPLADETIELSRRPRAYGWAIRLRVLAYSHDLGRRNGRSPTLSVWKGFVQSMTAILRRGVPGWDIRLEHQRRPAMRMNLDIVVQTRD